MTRSQHDPPSGNQYEYWRKKLKPQIESVKAALAARTPASELADVLLREHGLGSIHIIMIFREATGASLGDLKSFGQWWDSSKGVIDAAAFDAWADEVLRSEHR